MGADTDRPGRMDGSWHAMAGVKHFLQQSANGYASNDSDRLPTQLDPQGAGECHFEIFRADERPVTSTRFSGGDWRWSLITADGLILAQAGGYANEESCRAAVTALQTRAATSPVHAPTVDRR